VLDEEIQNFPASKWLGRSDIQLIRFKETPASDRRYLTCNQQVDHELTSRFNKPLARPNLRPRRVAFANRKRANHSVFLA